MKDGNVEGEAPARGPESLSKPQLDVGFFTNNLEAVLAVWRDEIGVRLVGSEMCIRDRSRISALF